MNMYCHISYDLIIIIFFSFGLWWLLWHSYSHQLCTRFFITFQQLLILGFCLLSFFFCSLFFAILVTIFKDHLCNPQWTFPYFLAILVSFSFLFFFYGFISYAHVRAILLFLWKYGYSFQCIEDRLDLWYLLAARHPSIDLQLLWCFHSTNIF